MSNPSRATDANDPLVPNNIQQYQCSPGGTFESSDLWNDCYDDSATASDITALDCFDSQVYNNPASLLAPLPDLATDYDADYYPPNFSDCVEESSSYGVMSGEAMAYYSPYYYAAEPSSGIFLSHDSQPATQLETGNAFTGTDCPTYEGPPAPTQRESNNYHPDETDIPKARIIRKKGRRPRPPAVNEETQPPPAAPCPSVELGEPGPTTQRADPRTSQAPLKRKLDFTPPPEFDRAGKRRRMNTNQDAAQIRLESGEEQAGGMGSSESLGYKSPRKEGAPVRPCRSLHLSKRWDWDEGSYNEDDSSSMGSSGPGEPGPSTWAQNADVSSPGSANSDCSWAPTPKPISRSKRNKYRCLHCGRAPGFGHRSDLDRHKKYHCRTNVSGDRDKSHLECPDCHTVYSRPDSLRRHRGTPSACANNIARSLKKAKRPEKHDDYEEEDDSDRGE